jgi:putative sterol carrier protein
MIEGNMSKFPTQEWIKDFAEKLNTDTQYAEIAQNWESDVVLSIEPEGSLNETVVLYFDLWHGTCREAKIVDNATDLNTAFMLSGSYNNYKRVIKGDLHPMQAMLTRKLSVRGDMGLLMRSIPTVLDFVRCAREITEDFV